ncbi:DHHW family protein [Angustibacter luteus]|uniref:DHHW family protein n=1 Tax=Angustibacter luteus TaxID=658456 RepID=A0ABW1JG38_9ACTN
MTRPTRHGRRLWLAAAPGLALVLFVTALGFGAVALDPPARSTLDGRSLQSYEPATVDSVRDGSWMRTTEAWLDDHVPGRQRWLEAHASLSKGVLRQPVVNNVYVGDQDGFLLGKPAKLRLPTTFGDRAEQLGKDVRATGTPILWVYAPRREEVFDDKLPAAWQGGYTGTKPAYLKAIARGGPVLDLGPTLSDPATREANYWRTDHHWTPAGAIRAVDLVSQRLAGMGVRIGTDTRAYHTVTYPDFYGSLAREVTAGATRQPDAFDVLQPDAWRARICRGSVCNKPTFVTKAAKAKDKYANRYLAFMGGDSAYQRSVNPDPAARGTVLILKDSFGDAFSTYFSERVKTLITIDERHYNKPENIRDVVARVKPDVVIVMHNQVSTLGNVSFDSQVWTDMDAVRARRAAKGSAAVGDG